MGILNKVWVRIFVSIIAGGIAAESIHLITAEDINDRTNDQTEILVFPVAIVVYLVLTYFVNRTKLK